MINKSQMKFVTLIDRLGFVIFHYVLLYSYKRLLPTC